MNTTEQALFENAYIEVKELCAERETPFTDAEILPLQDELKINIIAGAIQYVSRYGGKNNFIESLKVQLVKNGQLSMPQIRGALNVMRTELRAGLVKEHSRAGETQPIAVTEKQAEGPIDIPRWAQSAPDVTGSPVKDSQNEHQCYRCKRWFPSVRAVMNHKTTGCSPSAPATEAETKAVMDETKAEKTFLDLMPLPNGFYAVPWSAAKDGYVYLSIRTLTRPMKEDRRYRYGKIITGAEWIPAGTIQVRSWTSDQKELVGMQRPGQGYDGQYVEGLIQIMEAPAAYALLFANVFKRCYICGKGLTDSISKMLKIGPDCQEKYGTDYLQKFHRYIPPQTGAAINPNAAP
jgi:hypothetical protein